MSKFSSNVPYHMLRVAVVVTALVVLGGPVVASADDPTVTRVEEDWLLWVYEPAGSVSCPQFHTIMSPGVGLDSFYFQVTWNYWESPQFAPGGFQVQSWNGESLLSTSDIGNTELSLFAEVITWTQVMETDGSQLGFTILNGNSATWGEFGYPETFVVTDGMVTNLNDYSPEASVANATITYGRNRVIVWSLRAVRYYDEEGDLIRQDDTYRPVFEIFNQH